MNKSEIAEKARKRFAFEQYAKTVTWNTYEGDDDPFAFFPESGVYANGDIQLAWVGWQWRERAIAESQAPTNRVTYEPIKWSADGASTGTDYRIFIDGIYFVRVSEEKIAKRICEWGNRFAELGDGEPSPSPESGHWFVAQRVVKKAIQWNGNNEYEIADFMPAEKFNISDSGAKLFIETLEGCMEANVLDWIIRGVNGEFYPCKPDIFAKTYEPFESGAAQEVSPPSPSAAELLAVLKRLGYDENGVCLDCGHDGCDCGPSGDTRELKAALKEMTWLCQSLSMEMVKAEDYNRIFERANRLLGSD
jgi:hypothetical protein